MCIVEQVKKGTTGDVSFGMITICPSTGDVVWDDFEGRNDVYVIGALIYDVTLDTLMRLELEVRSWIFLYCDMTLIMDQTRLVHTRPAELLLPKTELSSPTTKMLHHFTRPVFDI